MMPKVKQNHSAKLQDLLHGFIMLDDEWHREIAGLATDSRCVKKGDLFFAYPGESSDGREFISIAIEKGAAAILCEADESLMAFQRTICINKKIPLLMLTNLRAKLGLIAAKFYGNPAKKITTIGITGTNGKTSCSYFLANALQELNQKSALIGTLGNGPLENLVPSDLTTPNAIELQKYLAEFRAKAINYTIIEASSHSLIQNRTVGSEFDLAIFTNLTHDHLDYHKTMEAYGDAKCLLFRNSSLRSAVINADDAFGRQLIEEIPSRIKVYSYGLSSKEAQISAKDISLDGGLMQAKIESPWGSGVLKTHLIGKFNISNLLAVLTSLCVLGLPFNESLAALNNLKTVPGRMETFGGDEKQPLVIVDYAHTPDALEQVLATLNDYKPSKLYCVFGCGGGRDRAKRPLMGQIAAHYAKHLVVTNDNPRFENPEDIVADILSALTAKQKNDKSKIMINLDRASAIDYAIQAANPDDIVLVAGKGHETYQQIGQQCTDFSDAEHVKLALAGKKK